jgi:hypothetical protein
MEKKTYIVRTHANKEFDGHYSHASATHSYYEEQGTVLVLEIEVEQWYASAYERQLDSDSAVISYREA